MCGIIGSIGYNRSKEAAENAVRYLSHRGPDQSGVFISESGSVFLGHTRLSIIELSKAGSQPMSFQTTDGSVQIVYNGEVYNYREIQQQLRTLGHSFIGDSDTEVVLHAYIEWGMDAVKKFHGMFAFAIWDERIQELLLCRDRFGVKPLYMYAPGTGGISFASELKALYALPEYEKHIDMEAVSLYFQFGFIPAPRTIFKKTYKIEPGRYVQCREDGTYTTHTYWTPVESAQREDLPLEAVLERSFSYRTVADVDVGVFLSGGVDSSLVAALLQKNSNTKIKTFTIGFEEAEYDEAPRARKIAEHLGTEHHEYYVSADEVQRYLSDIVEIFDEPFGDSSALVTYVLARYARDEVKVALSGDGGDEMFFGYTKYVAANGLHDAGRIKKWGMRQILRMNPRLLARLYTYIPGATKYSNLREKISKLQKTLTASSTKELYIAASSYWEPYELDALMMESKQVTPHLSSGEGTVLEQFQLWDVQQYLPDDILVKSDRTTMAVGLEAREPFLDQDIWAYVRSRPSLQLQPGTKYALTNILEKYLPKKYIHGQKTGFRPPMYEWLTGPWKEMVQQVLDDKFIEEQGIFSPSYIQALKQDFLNGTYVHPDKVWILVAFQLWYKRWYGV